MAHVANLELLVRVENGVLDLRFFGSWEKVYVVAELTSQDLLRKVGNDLLHVGVLGRATPKRSHESLHFLCVDVVRVVLFFKQVALGQAIVFLLREQFCVVGAVLVDLLAQNFALVL